MKKLLVLMTGLLVIGGSALAYDAEVIGIFFNQNPGTDLTSGISETTTSGVFQAIDSYVFVLFPTSWEGEPAGVSYFEFTVEAPTALSGYFDPACPGSNINFDAANKEYDVLCDFTGGTPLTPHVDYGNHIFLGTLNTLVPDAETLVELTVGPYAGASDGLFDGDPYTEGPGVLCGTDDTQHRTLGNQTGGVPGVGPWTTAVAKINGSMGAEVDNEITTWSDVKALFK